jgi:hypothetical protein
MVGEVRRGTSCAAWGAGVIQLMTVACRVTPAGVMRDREHASFVCSLKDFQGDCGCGWWQLQLGFLCLTGDDAGLAETHTDQAEARRCCVTVTATIIIA